MEKQRKRIVICFCAARSAASEFRECAFGLSFSPSASSTNSEASIDLYVMISGLENGVQMYSFKNLAAFDFTIRYDPAVLSFDDYLTEAEHDEINMFVTDEGQIGGTGSIASVSRNSCLQNFGADDALAMLSFIGTGLNKGYMSILDTDLGDDRGNSLSARFGDVYTDISDSCEYAPSCKQMFMLKCGVIALAKFKDKFKRGSFF